MVLAHGRLGASDTDQVEADTVAPPSQPSRPNLVTAIVIALVVGIAIGWTARWASSDTGVSTGSSEATVERWMTALEDQDVGDIAKLYAEDATGYDEAGHDGFSSRDGVIQGCGIFGIFDEVRLVEPVAITDEAAVVRWPLVGVDDWELTGISALEMSDGIVQAEKVYYSAPDGP